MWGVKGVEAESLNRPFEQATPSPPSPCPSPARGEGTLEGLLSELNGLRLLHPISKALPPIQASPPPWRGRDRERGKQHVRPVFIL